MTDPVISYCVPAYNVADYLGDCINSILHEGLQEIEVIIVDDASTDETAHIAGDLCRTDDRVRLIRHTYNKGLPSARNTALQDARGDFIRHVDSDDLVTRGSSQHLLKVIGASDVARGSSLAFHATGMDGYPMEWANQGIGDFKVDNLWQSDFFRSNALGYVWLYLYRNTFLHDIGDPKFSEGISILEDDIYNAEVLPQASSIALTGEVVALYRTGGMSSPRPWTFRQYMEQANALTIAAGKLASNESFLASYLNRKAAFVIQKTKVARTAGLSFEQFCAYCEIIRTVYCAQDVARYSHSSKSDAPGQGCTTYSEEDTGILLRVQRAEIDTLYNELQR